VSVTSSKDNTLIEPRTSLIASNGSGPNFFAGRTSQNDGTTLRRGIIAFDLTSIPAGSVVQTVTLTLNMSLTSSGVSTVNLHRLLADWGEGGSSSTTGAGGSAQTGDATWLHRFFETESWTTPGGDFSPTISVSQQVNSNGFYTWGPTAQMVADVQDWINNPSQNFGWILIGDEQAIMTVKRFDTHENNNANVRPRLTITFLPTAVEENDNNLPNRFSLSQNYPNPFNPTTVIRYNLAQNGAALLEIFNVLGERVKTVVQSQQPAGAHSVQWNGANDAGALQPSGVYLYRLQSGGRVETRKMLFVR
jgi:hypothetical protein